MFEGYIEERIDCAGTQLFVRRSPAGGGRPPMLMLHGFPQTSAMWRDVAPQLDDAFEVICPDLRGYGASGKPGMDRPGEDLSHALYSKRAMGADCVALMAALGHERFFVVGHDRGGLVSHRLALDHEARVPALMVLDIAPTREMYARADAGFATAYWHWFFLTQPYPIPERIIGADPDLFLELRMMGLAGGRHPFSDEALNEYRSCHRDPGTIHAICEDYRAACSIDIEHDDDDDDDGGGEGGGRKLRQPLSVLWACDGIIDATYGAIDIWHQRAVNVSGKAMPGSHYFPEEDPDALALEIRRFFLGHSLV